MTDVVKVQAALYALVLGACVTPAPPPAQTYMECVARIRTSTALARCREEEKERRAAEVVLCRYEFVGGKVETKMPRAECEQAKAAAAERRAAEAERVEAQRQREAEQRAAAREEERARAEHEAVEAAEALEAELKTPEVMIPLLSAYACEQRLQRAELEHGLDRERRIGRRAGYVASGRMNALSRGIEVTREKEKAFRQLIRKLFQRPGLPCARVSEAAACIHDAEYNAEQVPIAFLQCGDHLPR